MPSVSAGVSANEPVVPSAAYGRTLSRDRLQAGTPFWGRCHDVFLPSYRGGDCPGSSGGLGSLSELGVPGPTLGLSIGQYRLGPEPTQPVARSKCDLQVALAQSDSDETAGADR